MKFKFQRIPYLIKNEAVTGIIRIMKISFIFLFIFSFQLLALNTKAQDAVIELKTNSMTVGQLINEIEKQTDYLVVYSNREVDANRKVDVQRKSDKVSSYLNEAFEGTDIGYDFENNYIVLMKKANRNATAIAEMIRSAQQQGKTITGKVVDVNGEPIIGANIIEVGTTNGTVTDIDGNFSLKVADNATIRISYIGYVEQEINTAEKTSFNITLAEDTQALEEVVVIGYGTMRKSDLTGAIATIEGDKLAQRNTTQLSTALQGAIPGLMVTRSNNEPGATATIKIRGITTIGDSDPLVIVDGVPGDINQVHPKNIESISVLKDAASASIYGARAAAGVILITTKRAKENELRLSYDFSYGMEIPTSQPKNVGVQRYLEMANELRYNDNPQGGLYQEYTQEQVENWVKMNPTDPDKYPITNWYDLIVRDYAPRQTHTLNLSGGSKMVKTRASMSYDKTDGLLKINNIKYERYLVSINNDFDFNKYLSASLDFNLKRTETKKPSQTNIWYMLRAYPSTFAYQWSHGGLADVKGGNNPYGRIKEGGNINGWYTKLGGRLAINFTPIEGFKLSAVASPNYSISKVKTFNLQAGYTGPDDPNTIIGYFQDHTSTSLNEDRNDNNDITTQLLATYNKNIGNHNFNLMAGNENYYYFNERLNASRDQYELKEFPYLDIGPTSLIDNGGRAYENAYSSFFGRIMYNYANRYLLQANYRYDGSSRFHPDYRWGGFPSLSVGWVVSEESFVKNAGLQDLSFLKLRASFGTLGNERIGNYPYQALMDFTKSLFYDNASSVTPTFYNGVAQIQYAIQNISWETTQTFDVGFDAVLFDNRLNITADYYYKETKDMLLTLKIPGYVGFANPEQNAGKMYTNGFDFEVGWNDNIGDFNYGIALNLSDFVSKMGDLGGTQFIGSSQVKFKGSEFNEWYGYLSDGLFLSQEDVDNSAKLNSNVTVGDVKFLDISGPDGKPDGLISSEYDRVLLGGSLPRFMFGGIITGDYKDLDISIAFQGVGKQNVRITSGMATAMPGNWGNIPAILDGNYWSSFNTEEENAKARYPRLTYVNGSSNLSMSDYWMFNGRYFRMKNLTFGYTLPATLTQKVNISRLRFYVSGNDLFCLSKYPTGWDPERGDSSYPITTSLLFGININF
jgi:TonB-linked SusC/RagA family outer membrane protein